MTFISYLIIKIMIIDSIYLRIIIFNLVDYKIA